jgi:hypothetical protein
VEEIVTEPFELVTRETPLPATRYEVPSDNLVRDPLREVARTVPLTVRALLNEVDVPIPTFPLPLTKRREVPAEDCTSKTGRLGPFATPCLTSSVVDVPVVDPVTWRRPVGLFVPMPTDPVVSIVRYSLREKLVAMFSHH